MQKAGKCVVMAEKKMEESGLFNSFLFSFGCFFYFSAEIKNNKNEENTFDTKFKPSTFAGAGFCRFMYYR